MTLMGHTWSHMWYLYLILFLYLITPLLKKVLRVLPVWGVAAMMAVIFLGSSVAPFLNKVLDVNSIPVLPDGGVYFLYYLCGYFFAVREVCVDKGRNVWLTAAVAVLALGMILSRTLADSPFRWHTIIRLQYCLQCFCSLQDGMGRRWRGFGGRGEGQNPPGPGGGGALRSP